VVVFRSRDSAYREGRIFFPLFGTSGKIYLTMGISPLANVALVPVEKTTRLPDLRP
jgi:hypothetical protein